jgi:SAM-dependent methyltransferase
MQEPTDDLTTEDQEIVAEPEDETSPALRLAAAILARAGAYSVLCPACGTGCASTYLARQGFQVTAYDVSQQAVAQTQEAARRAQVNLDCFVDDLMVPRRRMGPFDGLFASDLLHQMLAGQRRRLLRSFHRLLRQGGVLVVSVLSMEDTRYGYGRPLEEDTFELGLGEAMHFYSMAELHHDLSEFFLVAAVEEAEETVEHCGFGKQTYQKLVATALKLDRQ